MEQNQALFHALRMERLVTFITIGLIVFVAALNILISLIMMVMEKTRDIAVLMSMGSRKSQIRRLFIAQIAHRSVRHLHRTGPRLYVFLGRGTLSSADARSRGLLDQLRALSPLTRSISCVWVALVAVGVSLLATIYPSWSAARILPVGSRVARNRSPWLPVSWFFAGHHHRTTTHEDKDSELRRRSGSLPCSPAPQLSRVL